LRFLQLKQVTHLASHLDVTKKIRYGGVGEERLRSAIETKP